MMVKMHDLLLTLLSLPWLIREPIAGSKCVWCNQWIKCHCLWTTTVSILLQVGTRHILTSEIPSLGYLQPEVYPCMVAISRLLKASSRFMMKSTLTTQGDSWNTFVTNYRWTTKSIYLIRSMISCCKFDTIDVIFSAFCKKRPNPGGWILHIMYELTWVLEGVLFEALMYIVRIKERYYFSLECTFRKVVKGWKVKINVQRGALRFREKFDNRCVNFILFIFSFIIVIC